MGVRGSSGDRWVLLDDVAGLVGGDYDEEEKEIKQRYPGMGRRKGPQRLLQRSVKIKIKTQM